MDMTNQPNKATVKDGLPTAEKSFNDFAKSMGYQTWSDMRNAFCMDGFALNDRIFKAAEAHTAALRERVKELEGLMHEFVDRVERGEVRSKRTYAKFKEALKK